MSQLDVKVGVVGKEVVRVRALRQGEEAYEGFSLELEGGIKFAMGKLGSDLGEDITDEFVNLKGNKVVSIIELWGPLVKVREVKGHSNPHSLLVSTEGAIIEFYESDMISADVVVWRRYN